MSDILDRVDEFDESNYLEFLASFGSQITRSFERGRSLELEQFECNSIVIAGMGGSGIAGDIVRDFVAPQTPVPVQSNKFYEIPGWVDSSTLAVLVSYSGNTEETLSAFRNARSRGARCLAITSNGRLRERTKEENIPTVEIPADFEPRAAAAFLVIPILSAFEKLDLIQPIADRAVQETIEAVDAMSDEFDPSVDGNRAIQIAETLSDTLPLLYGSPRLTSVLGVRFKNQLTENAKMYAVASEIPEMNHNEIMAFENLSTLQQRFTGVFLRDSEEHERVKKRFTIIADLLNPHVDSLVELETRGDSRLCRFFSMMLFTDYVSYYLALLNGEDPSGVGLIENLKREL